MLRLFRQLRQSLIMPDNARKYLLYAIGEILLVVIGILIALQVNNWNEARIEVNQQAQIIQSLHNEFQDNLAELKYDITRLDSLTISTKRVLEIFNQAAKPEEEVFNRLLGGALGNPTWNPSSYVLNDLKNSGQISRLKNLELQRKLFAWERYYENTLELSEVTDQSTLALITYINENGSLRDIDALNSSLDLEPSQLGFNNVLLLNDIRFENYLDDKYLTGVQLMKDYLKIVDMIEDLLKTMEP